MANKLRRVNWNSSCFWGGVQWKEAVRHWLIQLAVELESIGAGCCVTLQGDKNGLWSQNLKAELAASFSPNSLNECRTGEVHKRRSGLLKISSRSMAETLIVMSIGHTRMATESVVDTYHSHPFTSAPDLYPDLCIVHNGQIPNYYKLRFTMRRGVVLRRQWFRVIAHFIHHQKTQSKTLEAAWLLLKVLMVRHLLGCHIE